MGETTLRRVQGWRLEQELILRCARASQDLANTARILELARGELNWCEVVAAAVQHNLAPAVYDRLRAIEGVPLPPEHSEMLREAVRDAARWSLILLQELLRLCGRFEAEQIPVIPYKGPVLSWLAYQEVTRRACTDLDFVVPQAYIPRSAAALQQAGYAAAFDLCELHAGDQPHAPGEYAFLRGANFFRVELHTERTLRYFPVPLDFDRIGQRLTPLPFAGQTVRTFSPEVTLVMLCVHGAKHFWDRLGWILDIAGLVASQPVDWPGALSLAEQMQSTRVLLLGLWLAHDLFEAPLPEEICERARRDRRVQWLAARVCEPLAGRSKPSAGVVRRAAFRWASRDEMVSGLWHTLRLALRPTESDRSTIGLPSRLSSLYFLVRVWRLFRLYGLGWRGGPRAEADLGIFDATPPDVAEEMLHLAEAGPEDVVYDLGCGDGAIAVAAAKKFGLRAVGIDIHPERIAGARAKAKQHGVEHRTRFVVQDAKTADFSEATVVTLYTSNTGNLKLVNRLREQLRPGARIVSRNFQIFGWHPDQCVKHILPNGVPTYLYLWKMKAGTEKSAGGEEAAETLVRSARKKA